MKIFNLLRRRAGEWVNIGELERVAHSEGKIAQNCGRRLRELVTEYPKRIEVTYKGDAHSAFYRYVPSDYESYHKQMQLI
jgi:hypothetical protein